MELQINLHVLVLVSLCSAQYYYPAPMYQPSLSQPERLAGGLSPRYQDLVFQYIAGLAGRQQPPQAAVFPTRIEDFGVSGGPSLPDLGRREPVTENPAIAAPAPLQPSHLLPSDFILLASSPQSQFFGHFDVVKNNKMRQSVQEGALPPVGGAISNFLIQREIDDNKVKRQTFAYSNDGVDEDVVIHAAENRGNEESSTGSSSSSSTTTTSDIKNCTSTSTSDKEPEEPQPSVAQSKPTAIALAGAGGVAQAAPVATAVVGKDGLAIAAPSATAIAGKGASGALQIGGEEKVQRRSSLPQKNKME